MNLSGKRNRPDFIAIAGASVGGLCLATELFRSGWAGRVAVVTGPTLPSRRLIAGCSLRTATIARLAGAYGCSVPSLFASLSGGKGTFHRLASSVAWMTASGTIRFAPAIGIHELPLGQPVGLSMRHAAITQTLRKLAEALGVPVTEKTIGSAEDLASLAKAGNALLVNATPKNLLATPDPPSPRRYVVACQAPFLIAPGGLQSPLAEGLAYAPFAIMDDGLHVAFFTPFYDDLSPQASWYGINTRVMPAGAAFDRAAVVDSTRRGLERLAAGLGLTLHDPDETLATVVAGATAGAPPASRPRTFDATRAFSSGAPAIYVDGMLAAATGARAYAKALGAGAGDPERAVARALQGIRFRNRLIQQLMTWPVEPTAWFLTRFPWLAARWFGIDWLQ